MATTVLMESSTKSQRSSNSGQIGSVTLELHALELQKNSLYTTLSDMNISKASLGQILFVASMGSGKGCIRFWGRLDQNCCCHGNQKLPLTCNVENGVSTFSLSFLIGSSPNLQVSKTGVQSQMSSNSSRIGSFTKVLHALEHRKNFS